ncbi:hypothetical protein P7C71_g1915, partial [Lecanoromycetidae sp. Uapishka_2]
MRYIILIALLAANTLTNSIPTNQSLSKRVPITITVYSGAECQAAGPDGTPGFWAINMIYGTNYAKVIRSYRLSRDLLNTEQLDFSTASANSGAAMDKDKSAIDNPTSCNHYDYSAFASTTGEGIGTPGVSNGRTAGCYTIENPHNFEQCVRIKMLNCPAGLCSGEVASDATNGQSTLPEGTGANNLSPDGLAEGVIH